jgi:hypothetical protein
MFIQRWFGHPSYLGSVRGIRERKPLISFQLKSARCSFKQVAFFSRERF